ncbi:MAG: 16S rRNA (guanine(527)-N(7))-methyltransferase RsmG [Arenimonas sp.]
MYDAGMPATDPLAGELADGLRALQLPEALAPQLLAYLDLLARWNQAYNLTAVRDRGEMLRRHLFDSLAMQKFADSGPLADLGAGPGLPGIPLAIADPKLQVTLVDSNGKMARFQREAVRTLGLANVRVVQSRAENLAEPGAFRLLTARALDRLAGIIDVGGHLLAPGGRLLALKGQRPDAEIAELPGGWTATAVHVLTVPGLAAERHLVEVTRGPAEPA